MPEDQRVHRCGELALDLLEPVNRQADHLNHGRHNCRTLLEVDEVTNVLVNVLGVPVLVSQAVHVLAEALLAGLKLLLLLIAELEALLQGLGLLAGNARHTHTVGLLGLLHRLGLAGRQLGDLLGSLDLRRRLCRSLSRGLLHFRLASAAVGGRLLLDLLELAGENLPHCGDIVLRAQLRDLLGDSLHSVRFVVRDKFIAIKLNKSVFIEKVDGIVSPVWHRRIKHRLCPLLVI